MSFFKERHKPKSKGLICGETGCGKTYLIIELAKMEIFGPILIIDTDDGTKYELHRLPEGSEVVLVRSNVEVMMVLKKLHAAGRDIPFNTIILDDMTSVWSRFMTSYGIVKAKLDAIKAKKYGKDATIRNDVDAYEKSKRMGLNDWGSVKEKHGLLVRSLFDLPCHIICTAWTKLIFNDKNEPIGEVPKVEKNLPYMMDYSLIMRKINDKKRVFEALKDRSKIIKKGTPATAEILQEIALAIPGVEVEEVIAPKSAGEFTVSKDDMLPCDECGEPTSVDVLNKVEAKCGEMICWACQRQKAKDA